MAGLLEPVLDPEQEFEERLERARQAEAKSPVTVDPDSRIVWTPQEGFQTDFLQCPIFELLGHGTRGGGKTDTLLMDFAQHVGQGYGAAWRGILFRETYPQLADVVAKSEKWFRQIFPGAKFNRSKMQWEWPTGEMLLLRHMQRPEDYWGYHGHELSWIGWEELTNWATDECYKMMFACCRSSNPKVPRKIRATTNPYGIGHSWVMNRFQLQGQWWKTIVIEHPKDIDGRPEPPRASIHSHLDENQILLKADPHYKTTISASASNKAMAQAWLDGSWDLIAGGMFDDVWDPNRNLVHDFNVPPTWRIDRAFDWGSSKPFSVGWYATSDGSDLLLKNGKVMSTVRGDLFRIGEWYGWTGRANEGKRMLAVDVAKGVVEREVLRGWRTPRGTRVFPGPADSSIYVVENGNCIANDMDKPVRLEGNQIYHGVTWIPADKRPGSRKMGWEMMRKMIRNARAAAPGTVRERPGLFVVAAQCPQFLRTVLSLPRDPKDMDDVDCFVAGTMVATPNGPRPIETIAAGDFVETPIGPRPVTRSYLSGAASTVRVALSNGHVLQGTARHKIYVPGRGLVRLDALVCGLTLTQDTICQNSEQQIGATECWKCGSRAFSTESIRSGATSSAAVLTRSAASRFCIARFGLTTEGRFPTACTCTTEGGAPTRSETWNSSLLPTTPGCILQSGRSQSRRLFASGEAVTEEGDNFARTLARCVRERPNENLRALIVASLLSRSTRLRSIAALTARQPTDPACLRSLARSAASSSGASRIGRRKSRRVPTRVVGLFADATPRDVFNLTVKQAGLFFAAGVLCSNTDAEDHIGDEVRYRVRSVGTEVTGGRTVGMY